MAKYNYNYKKRKALRGADGRLLPKPTPRPSNHDQIPGFQKKPVHSLPMLNSKRLLKAPLLTETFQELSAIKSYPPKKRCPKPPSFCYVCGKSAGLSFNASGDHQKLLDTWKVKTASSLCSILEVDSAYAKIFVEAVFCEGCQHMACEAEHYLDSLCNMQLRIIKLKSEIASKLAENYAKQTGSVDVDILDMSKILNGLKVLFMEPCPQTADSVTPFTDIKTRGRVNFLQTGINRDPKRLKKLKDRAFPLENYAVTNQSLYEIQSSADEPNEDLESTHYSNSESQVEIKEEELLDEGNEYHVVDDMDDTSFADAFNLEDLLDSAEEFPQPAKVCPKFGLEVLQEETTEKYERFKCSQCLSELDTNYALKMHLRMHRKRVIKLPSRRCKVCGKRFEGTNKTINALQNHERLHSERAVSGPFDCVICDNSSLRNTMELRDHVRKEHEPHRYMCDVNNCEKAFLFQSHLEMHQRCSHSTTSGSRVLHEHKCSECAYVGKSTKSLRAHILQNHRTERPFICSVEGCNRAFALRNRMISHQKTVHRVGDSVPLHSCRVCGKEFTRSASLAKHETCHSTARPFICEICSASFKTWAHLHQHKKIREHYGKVGNKSKVFNLRTPLVHAPEKKTANNWKLQQPRKPRLKPTNSVPTGEMSSVNPITVNQHRNQELNVLKSNQTM